jgi:hypothetical protein
MMAPAGSHPQHVTLQATDREQIAQVLAALHGVLGEKLVGAMEQVGQVRDSSDPFTQAS